MAAENIDHAFTARSSRGGSSEPTYAGALSFMRRRYTKDVKGADAVVWGVPFDAAVTNRPGARFGPQAIRRASAIMDNDPQYPFARDLFEDLAVVDYGDCLLDSGNHQKTPAAIEREAAKLASQRYEAGDVDLLDVLDAQRTLLTLEEQQVNTSKNRASAHVQLYQALGGGWSSGQ